MKNIRWGIIGCGDVTEVKSGPGFQKAEGSELVAVMRRNGELARDYARRHNVPTWYDRAEELLHNPDIDAVYIATPPSTHKDYTLAAAKAGKAVLVEKPMGLNFAECEAMIAACEVSRIPLFTAFYRRALPRFLKVKSLIDQGTIGEIRSVTMRLYHPPKEDELRGIQQWRVNPAISGGGHFFDLAPHMIDLLHYFLGPIETVSGKAVRLANLYEAEDTVAALFSFTSDVQGTALWTFVAGEQIDQTEIIGSGGSIRYPTFLESPIVLRMGDTVEEFIIPHPPHVHQPLIQTVVDELLGRGKSPSTGATGARVSWVMDEIVR
jgi:predicted dehydrogenase